jgi:hypothetical protein
LISLPLYAVGEIGRVLDALRTEEQQTNKPNRTNA